LLRAVFYCRSCSSLWRSNTSILRVMKSIFRSAPVVTVLGGLIWAYMALCGRTIRWKVEGLENAKTTWQKHDAIIVAAWHSTILTLPTAWTRYMRHWPGRRAPSAMMISLSADGEPVARAIKHLGLTSIRGSSGYKRKRRDKGGGAAIAAQGLAPSSLPSAPTQPSCHMRSPQPHPSAFQLGIGSRYLFPLRVAQSCSVWPSQWRAHPRQRRCG